MGRFGKRRRREARGNNSESGTATNDDPRGDSRDRVVNKDNEKFKSYYKNQNILSDEEFEAFYECLKTPLPSTFRITGTRRYSHAMEILRHIEEKYVREMQDVVIDGVQIEPPKPVSWYPDRLCWQVNAPRLVIKRSPEFKKFHRFMVTETEVGNLSRQEAVSMVPPLLMDIQPHQWVLDMCAAPGSKTAQIVEAVHANDKLNEMPAGLVVANDADDRRSQMLVHQLKRLQSPCFVATNHDGAHFPGIRIPDNNGRLVPLRFDRVLCDVPCSGDGTLRKNEKIWNEWSQGGALALHSVQVQIFLRGARLTKVGGRIVYSTCSFNPVENEAVVTEVLRRTEGALKLKDVSSYLPGLKRKPGLKTWKVMTKDGKYINSVDEIEDESERRKFPKSVFPPGNADELHLERCVRIYPHLQDTGGFFVAVFEKVKPMTRAERDLLLEEGESPALELPLKRAASDSLTEKQEEEEEGDVKPHRRSHREAPFELMQPDNPESKEISDFYGLDPAFPRDQFLIRSEGKEKSKTIYFVSKAVKSLLTSSDIHRLNLVMTGVRLFVRQNQAESAASRTPYRLTCEGVPLLNRVLSDRRRVRLASMAELRTLLTEAYPNIDQMEPATAERLHSMEIGCCIFDFDAATIKDEAHDRTLLPMSFPVWRARVSLSVLLNKQDKRALCQRIFGVDPEATPAHLQERSVANQTKAG